MKGKHRDYAKHSANYLAPNVITVKLRNLGLERANPLKSHFLVSLSLNYGVAQDCL